MQKITVTRLTFVAAVVAIGSALAMAQPAELQTNGEHSLTGTVTCSGLISHEFSCGKNQTAQSCTLACVDQGSQFVLVSEGRPFVLENSDGILETYAGRKAMYVLQGNDRQLARYAGGRATVTGFVTEESAAPDSGGSMPGSMSTQTDASSTPHIQVHAVANPMVSVDEVHIGDRR